MSDYKLLRSRHFEFWPVWLASSLPQSATHCILMIHSLGRIQVRGGHELIGQKPPAGIPGDKGTLSVISFWTFHFLHPYPSTQVLQVSEVLSPHDRFTLSTRHSLKNSGLAWLRNHLESNSALSEISHGKTEVVFSCLMILSYRPLNKQSRFSNNYLVHTLSGQMC